MCELLGMNCNVPTDICFSLKGFRERGGRTSEHGDGWGIAFFEGNGVRLFRDDKPACDSGIVNLLEDYPIHSLNVIAHIRKASYGHNCLENTHPFIRELWGRNFVFAHNGDLHDFPRVKKGLYIPVGTTDSESAFCLILNRLREKYSCMPPSEKLRAFLQGQANEISSYGTFNFLMAAGDDYLYCHRYNKLKFITRKAPFGIAHLSDKDVKIDFREVTNHTDRVSVIATEELTSNETWHDLPEREVTLFNKGEFLA